MSIAPTNLAQWRVLSRTDCSLCEAMLVELCELFGEQAQAIQVQDIEGDAELERKYGQRLPVLLIDDEFVCAYRLDRERLGPWLSPG
jgi:hypothetical protein